MHDQLIKTLQPLVDRVRTDATATMEASGVRWTDHPLTPEALKKHLNGGPARGVAPIKPGESTTMVALLDLDSHKGEATWDEMASAAQMLTDAMLACGLVPSPWRSRGGNGIHLILMWDEPQDAYSVRRALDDVLYHCGMVNGTGGVHAGQVEIFPKQDRVPEGKWGNQFFLPLAGKSEPLIPALGWEGGGKESAVGMVWPVSSPVPVRVKPERLPTPAVYDSLERPILDRMLMTLPNSGGNEFDDRDLWFTTLCAYKDGGGDKEFAREWSAQHPTHSDDHFDSTWNSITIGAEGGARVDFLCNLAERYGFTELIESTFEVQVVDHAEPEAEPLPVFKRKPKTGEIETTVTNTVAAIGRPDITGMCIAHDVFRDEMIVTDLGTDQWRPINDADMVTVRMALERIGFVSAPKELARDAAVRVAANNACDTAIMWLSSLKWDGKPRVDRFLVDYLGCEDTPYTRAVSRYLWTALAGRCLQPGVQVDMAPIFKGSQGLRKSSLIRAIAPVDDCFTELDFDAKEEETVRNLRGVLVAEIAELSGLHTKALEWIKKFMTRRREKWVPKYKEFSTYFYRRSVFIGTTNDNEILADSTGNRRWLPVEVFKADVEGVVRDRDQLWAEGAALFERSGVCWREAEALASDEHEAFRIEDVWEPRVAKWLDERSPELEDGEGVRNGDNPVSVTDVLCYALGVNTANHDKLAKDRVIRMLRALGYESRTVRIPASDKPVRRWVRQTLRE